MKNPSPHIRILVIIDLNYSVSPLPRDGTKNSSSLDPRGPGRGIDFTTPRLLESSPKFAEDLENTEFPF